MDARGRPLLVGLLLLAFVLGVARTQPRLAKIAHDVKAVDDVWVLPPPRELRAATLGYTSAVTDLLWAKLLVEYGIHWAEHRSFPDLNKYIDALVELEPDYEPLYQYVDTLLVSRPVHGTEEDARAARRYLERGTTERPYDYKVWLQYGQFIAFLAPSFLTSDAEREQWRHEGATAIARAVDLGADPDRSLTTASMLSRWGERDAAIKSLQRGYALADDEAERAEIALKLQSLEASEVRDAAKRSIDAVDARWRKSMPFIPRGEFLLLGPVPDPLACAGPTHAGTPTCAHDWDEALEGER